MGGLHAQRIVIAGNGFGQSPKVLESDGAIRKHVLVSVTELERAFQVLQCGGRAQLPLEQQKA